MPTIFNRKELITTMDMQRQANIRSILSANGIAYTVRTENLQGSSALGGRSRGSSGSFGIDPNYSYEYHIYVHKNDYEKVPSRFMRKIVCRLRLNEVSRQ